jgi:hypothetical protein
MVGPDEFFLTREILAGCHSQWIFSIYNHILLELLMYYQLSVIGTTGVYVRGI